MEFKVDTYTGAYINKTDYHLYIAPRKTLKDIVAHYTITFANPQGKPPKKGILHLVPDVSGCFVFKFFDSLSIKVWGPTTKIVEVENDLKTAKCRFFVEFLPGGLYQVLGIDMNTLLNKKIDMQILQATLYNEINQHIQNMSSFDEIVCLMNDILEREIKKHPFNIDLTTYLKSNTELNAKELASHFQLSERQLNRYFNRYIGMGIKQYSKLVNINCLIKDLTENNLLDLTFDYHYFDQAHLNHTFKNICGTSPTHYLENLSDFYNELYKF